MTTAPVQRASLPLMPRAISISSQLRIGVYDCLYVALADQEQCELITADDKLIKNLKKQFPFIQSLSSMP
jgi:predicted nucleic acid-binding protein